MKKLLASALALTITSHAFASEYACKASYEKKLEKAISSKEKSVGTSLLFMIAAGPAFWGLGVAIGIQVHKSNKVEDAATAVAILDEAQSPSYEAYVEGLKNTHRQYLQQELETEINPKRIKKGKEALSLEEYAEKYPLMIEATAIDRLTKSINRAVIKQVNYETVAEMIREYSQDLTLCPDDKALSKQAIKELIISKLQPSK